MRCWQIRHEPLELIPQRLSINIDPSSLLVELHRILEHEFDVIGEILRVLVLLAFETFMNHLKSHGTLDLLVVDRPILFVGQLHKHR